MAPSSNNDRNNSRTSAACCACTAQSAPLASGHGTPAGKRAGRAKHAGRFQLVVLDRTARGAL
eukprot:11186827-Lingulodinium_polyedra.AAC.1